MTTSNTNHDYFKKVQCVCVSDKVTIQKKKRIYERKRFNKMSVDSPDLGGQVNTTQLLINPDQSNWIQLAYA